MDYRKKLVEKYKYSRKIKDLKKTHLPKYLLNAKRKRQIMAESKHRKLENIEVNNPGMFQEVKAEKDKKHIKTFN